MIKVRILAAWLLASQLLSATPVYGQTNYPGGVVELEIEKKSDHVPEVRYGLYEAVVLEKPEAWRVLIGIDLDTLPGEYVVYIDDHQQTLDNFRSIEIIHQPITNQTTDPLSTDYARNLVREPSKWSEIEFTNTQQPSLPLRRPAEGDWLMRFGDKVADENSGKILTINSVSMTTTELTNVIAPQNAIVSRVSTDTETGRSQIYLDHGRGLFSLIDGVFDVTVEPGNGVIAGAMLGNTGSPSDRSEPVTLYWQTRMNHTLVDPAILMQLSPN
ncbi:hypothetical protein GCM10008090_18990 [Arenicella chitinivorans]|uniref:M23ase beta-sheet core domain-containing protein n=1 Tax=Arenicella chitinivorans TaxID=1329800 RepID=A0A918RS77_9GAMM|nr:peptidoglycan DD-metalloendopeptidase family protein [Arenicella chitinivorans]GHA09232.1 hypothetical protein GCM10008090_18990 [Arenicella chitinivorans]